MGTHLTQGSFEVKEGQDVNEAVQNVWNAGGYVRLSEGSPNRIDVVAPTGAFTGIRSALQPTGGAQPSAESTNVEMIDHSPEAKQNVSGEDNAGNVPQS